MPVRYRGSLTTSGNSKAIRFEKALFRAHPEFAAGLPISAMIVGEGQMLVSVSSEAEVPDAADPVLSAYLAFIANDMRQHPDALQPLDHDVVQRASALTHTIDVDEGEAFPDDLQL